MLRVLLGDHRGVEGALCFIEDEDVFRGHEMMTAAVRVDVLLDAADKGLASAPSTLELVLQDLDQRAVSGQKHGWGRWLAVAAIDSQVVEPPCMGNLETDEGLAGTRDAGQENQPPRFRAGCLMDDLGDPVEGGVGGGRRSMDAREVAVLE